MIAVYSDTDNSFYDQVSIYSDILGVLVTRPGWSGNIVKEYRFILTHLAFELRDRVGQASCSDLVKGKIASPR
jgi:hypothetical protein